MTAGLGMLDDQQVAALFGTPTYVYDLDAVAAAVDELSGWLPEPVTLFYSVKANPHPDVLAVLCERGCAAEVSSTGEVEAVVAAGFEPSCCLYTGPAKTFDELATAIDGGVRRFSAESTTELHRLSRVARSTGRDLECVLRLNSALTNGATGLRMTGTASQFGIDLGSSPPNGDDLRVPGVDVVGVHFFAQTNCASGTELAAEFRAHIRVARQLSDRWAIPWTLLDLGGGFAAPYACPGRRPEYPLLADAITEALDEAFPRWATTMTVAFESGRYLVGCAGRLVCSVVDVKTSAGTTFVVLDTGVNHIGGMAGIGRILAARVTPDGAAWGDPAGSAVKLVGPLCTPADILNGALRGDRPRVGDLVGIPNAGAYGLTASLTAFLSRPAPAEVAVRGRSVVSHSRIGIHRTPLDRMRSNGAEDRS